MPDDLKRLVNWAHALGLMVLLDVVYNHFGPAGNYLHAYAESFFTERHHTPWGAGINVDGTDAAPVRDFFVHNALYWLEEYHFDGLRFDAVHAIEDDSPRHIVAEIAKRVRDALPGRHVHLVLENDRNTARWLRRRDDARPALHTAQWNDDVHHCWHTLLTGEADGYYGDYADMPVRRLGRCLAEGFAYQGEPSPHRRNAPRGEPSGHLPPSSFVGFLQNHDQIGNRAFGERLTELVPPVRLDLARAGLLLAPQIPLLFMGEEWGAKTPFLFFVDFEDDPALQEAVREGRKREFKSFRSFAERSHGREIPDPTLRKTAARSIIDWGEAQKSPHREIFAQTRELLALRRAEVIPLLNTRFLGATSEVSPEQVLAVNWRFSDDNLHFTANFGSGEAPVNRSGRRVVWTNAPAAGGSDTKLPPWTGLFTKGSTR
jgi:maltooligosyltrehalose trehalohydrolase